MRQSTSRERCAARREMQRESREGADRLDMTRLAERTVDLTLSLAAAIGLYCRLLPSKQDFAFLGESELFLTTESRALALLGARLTKAPRKLSPDAASTLYAPRRARVMPGHCTLDARCQTFAYLLFIKPKKSNIMPFCFTVETLA